MSKVVFHTDPVANDTYTFVFQQTNSALEAYKIRPTKENETRFLAWSKRFKYEQAKLQQAYTKGRAK